MDESIPRSWNGVPRYLTMSLLELGRDHSGGLDLARKILDPTDTKTINLSGTSDTADRVVGIGWQGGFLGKP